ncbi:MAG: diguanylate cyclase [Thiobacillaceae bacterium]
MRRDIGLASSERGVPAVDAAKNMAEFFPDLTSFIAELDAAVEAHMEWTRRVLRCAVLRVSPGEDALGPLAHTLCHFGRWFQLNKAHFEQLDAHSARRIEVVHQSMHDAVRCICTDMLAGLPGQATYLDTFEQTQSELIKSLAQFKTHLLSSAVQHDPLTELPMRSGIEADFVQIQKNCKRNNTRFYIGMIDVDHFKRVNDLYGHPVGDIALHHLAATLKRTTRPDEPLYRFGGEEFLVLMQCQTTEGAAAAAQRFIVAVRSAPLPIQEGEPLALTITLGLARVAEEEAMSSAVERADRALYEGKRAGRDRYVIAEA